jgi:hypothetical protein
VVNRRCLLFAPDFTDTMRSCGAALGKEETAIAALASAVAAVPESALTFAEGHAANVRNMMHPDWTPIRPLAVLLLAAVAPPMLVGSFSSCAKARRSPICSELPQNRVTASAASFSSAVTGDTSGSDLGR